MNIDTGHVVSGDEYDKMEADVKARHVKLPRHMIGAAVLAMAAGDSLFSGKHGGSCVAAKARDLARKQKLKIKKKMALVSRRRNRR